MPDSQEILSRSPTLPSLPLPLTRKEARLAKRANKLLKRLTKDQNADWPGAVIIIGIAPTVRCVGTRWTPGLPTSSPFYREVSQLVHDIEDLVLGDLP